jgi:hypothetical protein
LDERAIVGLDGVGGVGHGDAVGAGELPIGGIAEERALDERA